MKVNNEVLKDVINVLSYGFTNAVQQDLSRFVAWGIGAKEFIEINTIITQLRNEPYLSPEELIAKGISRRLIRKTLGGLDNFKSLLGIEDLSFDDFLTLNDMDVGEVVISYFHYQTFVEDVRRDHVSESERPKLRHNLKVDLGNECYVNSIPIINRHYISPIPAKDSEAVIEKWTP
ncbi:hypothetical protein KIV40_24820, partial [Vibrio sp. D173a]|nr:hypothetical protein [Vibrio sp. D173a]